MSVRSGQQRDVWISIRRGFLGRCPHFGRGRIFGRFLKVNDHCANCGEDLHHHRADDLPAYLVIAVVGHVAVAGVLWASEHSSSPPWMQTLILSAITVVLALGLLQPVKGAVIGLQWANRMHGFGGPVADAESMHHGRHVGSE